MKILTKTLSLLITLGFALCVHAQETNPAAMILPVTIDEILGNGQSHVTAGFVGGQDAELNRQVTGTVVQALGQVSSVSNNIADGRFTVFENDGTIVFDSDLTKLAVGTNASANGNDATAIGNASAADSGAVGVGYRANADGITSVAIGYDSDAAGVNSVAIGNTASAAGVGSIAIGYGAIITGTNAIQLGEIVPSYSPPNNTFSVWNTPVLESNGHLATNVVFYDATATNHVPTKAQLDGTNLAIRVDMTNLVAISSNAANAHADAGTNVLQGEITGLTVRSNVWDAASVTNAKQDTSIANNSSTGAANTTAIGGLTDMTNNWQIWSESMTWQGVSNGAPWTFSPATNCILDSVMFQTLLGGSTSVWDFGWCNSETGRTWTYISTGIVADLYGSKITTFGQSAFTGSYSFIGFCTNVSGWNPTNITRAVARGRKK